MTVNYKFKYKPFDHQLSALEAGWSRKEFGLFMEMGTGKSKVLIDNMGMLFLAGKINFALVIAPKGVYRNWVDKEIPEHMSDAIPHRVFRWVSSANKAQKKEMALVKEPFAGLTIFVMNVEAFSSLKGKQAGEWMSRAFGNYGMIAIDESTTIKNHKAKRSKNLCDIATEFKYRRILTGSPITKSPLDIYAQCHFLKWGILGHISYYAFQGMYAVTRPQRAGGRTFQQVVGYKNLDTLGKNIDKCSYRVLKKDCLDLPDKIYTIRYVSLTDEQKDMYSKIQKQALIMFDNGDMVSAPAVITQMLRVQQVLSGHLKTDDGDMVYFESKRMDALLEVLEEHQGKAIIWSRFRHDIISITNTLEKTFGKGSVASYYGDTKDDDRQRIVEKFQDKNSRLRFFVGNPSTAGYGLTLTEANLVVYYANDFNLETRIQSEDRAHRIGQVNKVTYVDLISEGTIDEKIVEALRNKINIGAKVLREEARQWLSIKPTKD
jgi:SNF2 family DNA or RNA helicase|tara:strand:+ start:804 stop:2273 length:1470 start_codon:yes stop_codon:yes gene_type:complete